MIPAFGMVILPQNFSTGNGQIPGCSCILSVGTYPILSPTPGYERVFPRRPAGMRDQQLVVTHADGAPCDGTPTCRTRSHPLARHDVTTTASLHI